MDTFPVITKEKQRLYEEKYKNDSELNNHVPDICGYYGRACRNMNDTAHSAPCHDCSLQRFVSAINEQDT